MSRTDSEEISWRSAIFWLIIPACLTFCAATPPFCWADNTKATLSCFVILGAFYLVETRQYQIESRRQTRANPVSVMTGLVMLGLLFSVLGDWLMNVRSDNERLFIASIASFFAAHFCFLSGFLANGKINRGGVFVAAALLLVYLPYYFASLAPGISSIALKGTVLAYLLISVLSLSASTVVRFSPWVRAIAVLGVCMIVFSDTLIARLVFNHNVRWSFLIIPTYISTHFLLTTAIILDGITSKAKR